MNIAEKVYGISSIFIILSIISLLIFNFGCEEKENAVSDSFKLTTVEHDNHKFVVFTGSHRPGSLLHHPDCSCGHATNLSSLEYLYVQEKMDEILDIDFNPSNPNLNLNLIESDALNYD